MGIQNWGKVFAFLDPLCRCSVEEEYTAEAEYTVEERRAVDSTVTGSDLMRFWAKVLVSATSVYAPERVYS